MTSKEDNKKKTEEGNAFAKAYKENKELMFKLERGNFDHVYVLKSTNDFWKLFGYSAITVAEIYGKKHNLSLKIHMDRDYHPFREGSLSFKGLDKLEGLLRVEGAKLSTKDSPNPDFIRAYRLKNPITETELNNIRQKYLDDIEKINEILKVKKAYPDVFYNIKNFYQLLVLVYKKPKDRGSIQLLDMIHRKITEINCNFTLMVNSMMNTEDWYKVTKRDLIVISAMLGQLYNSKVIAMEDAARLIYAYGILERSISEKRAK